MQLVQLSDPQGGVPDQSASQPSCEARGAQRGVAVSKQKPQVIFQATEARAQWSNFLTAAIAYSALKFIGIHAIGPTF